MVTTIHSTQLRPEDFSEDAHARRYRGELEVHPDAMRRLIELLNEPANEQRLLDAEAQGMPALAGIVRFVEGDPTIETVLRQGTQGHRFRQTVGVAIKLKMNRLGWRTTQRKGAVKNARYFTKAEHYESDRSAEDDFAAGALATLGRLEDIGDDEERAETGRELMGALATTRADEGRVF
jgi:hypothetical protein